MATARGWEESELPGPADPKARQVPGVPVPPHSPAGPSRPGAPPASPLLGGSTPPPPPTRPSGRRSHERPERGPSAAPEPPLVSSFLVWGSDRELVNRSARRLARWMDVEYLWVPLAEEARGASPSDVGVGRSSGPQERRAPERATAPEKERSVDGAIQRVVYQGARGQSLAHLRAELQLPEVLQELVGGLRKVSPFRVVVLANGDRIQGLDPWARGSTGSMLRALNELAVTPILTWSGPPGSSAPEFTYTLRAPAFAPSGGLGGTMVCERGRGHGLCLVRTIFPDHLVICKARLEPARYHSLPQGTTAECPLERTTAGR